MRAALISAPGVVEVVDRRDPAPAARQVVVAVAGCGVCGTDLHIRDGEFAPALPIVPGHEFAGEVVAVAADVDEVAVGDAVAVDPSLYCHECHYCRRGRGNLCERWGGIGVSTAGGAAEYVVVPAANCVRLPAGFPLADAALVEPLSCVVHAFDRLSLRQGDGVLIYGAGTMGLMMLEVARRAGAGRVDVVDPDGVRLETARLLGGGTAAHADELDAPRGWDVVIDCTGVPAAIEDGLTRVGRGGTYLQFGVPREQQQVRFSPYRTYREGHPGVDGRAAQLRSGPRSCSSAACSTRRCPSATGCPWSATPRPWTGSPPGQGTTRILRPAAGSAGSAQGRQEPGDPGDGVGQLLHGRQGDQAEVVG